MKIMCGLFIFMLIVISQSVVAQDPIGWHWYDEPAKQKISKVTKAFNKLTPMQQMHTLQYIFANLRDKAILTGHVDDIANYKEMQDFFVNKATRFSVGWSQMLATHPELNYALKYPHSNQLAHDETIKRENQEASAANIVGREYGFLYFYHASHPEDIIYTKIVKRFTKLHHISTKYVNVDNPSNAYRAKQLKINFFPAIMLLDPKTSSHTIFRYGFGVDSDLARRCYEILTNWNPEF